MYDITYLIVSDTKRTRAQEHSMMTIKPLAAWRGGRGGGGGEEEGGEGERRGGERGGRDGC